MRRCMLVLPFVLLFSPAVRSDDAIDLRDRALKAIAKNPADVKKMHVFIAKAKGIALLGTDAKPATQEIYATWPGSMRINWDFTVADKKRSIVQTASDDRGWRKETDIGVTELNIEKLNDLRADAYAIWTSTLFTLAEAQVKIAMAPPSKVSGVPVLGLKVMRRSFPDVTLYFDAKTALLRKMEYRNRNDGVTMKMEMIYDGHKEFGGLMLPTKQSTIVQGKQLFDWSAIEYSFPEKIDPKVFEKP